MHLLRVAWGLVRRATRAVIPAKYTSRRDRLNPEQDQLTTQNQFRSGM